MKRFLFLIPIVAFGALAAVLYVSLREGPPTIHPSPLIGMPAPTFQVVELDGEAQTFTRAELAQGRPTIVNFWASWCAPCRVEAPILHDLAAREDVTLYGVVYKDDPADARRFLAELGNPYVKINNDPDGRVGIEWGLVGVPETFVIDGAGIVRVRYAGPLTPRVVREILLPALADG